MSNEDDDDDDPKPLSRLLWTTLDDLGDPEEEPPWIIRPMAVAGALAELTGPSKGAGKSTLLLSQMKAVAIGGEVLGSKILEPGSVALITEEGDEPLKAQAKTAGLYELTDEERARIHLIQWHNVSSVTWSNLVAAAMQDTADLDPPLKLAIIDTLWQFTVHKEGQEIDSGYAKSALDPLRIWAIRNKVAVIVVRHDKASGGSVARSGRGSTGLTGGADIVCRLTAHKGRRSSKRLLEIVGRFGPHDLEIEWDHKGGYKLISEPEGSDDQASLGESILTILDGGPQDVAGLVRMSGGSRSSVMRALNDLEGANSIETAGKGRKGAPKKYKKVVGE